MTTTSYETEAYLDITNVNPAPLQLLLPRLCSVHRSNAISVHRFRFIARDELEFKTPAERKLVIVLQIVNAPVTYFDIPRRYADFPNVVVIGVAATAQISEHPPHSCRVHGNAPGLKLHRSGIALNDSDGGREFLLRYVVTPFTDNIPPREHTSKEADLNMEEFQRRLGALKSFGKKY